MTRLAVLGHLEWADVLTVDTLPRPGQWCESTQLRSEWAGAGATAARQLAKLAGSAVFYTALASDELADRATVELAKHGVTVHACAHAGLRQRRAIVMVDSNAERTITVNGPKLCPAASDDLPWDALDDYDGVCFVCGDAASLIEARRARIVVATARWLPAIREAGVKLDALVASASDPDECYLPGDLEPAPDLVVRTAGASGGTYTVAGEPERSYRAASTRGAPIDTYGAGDSFLAGLTFGLARGDAPAAALSLAARCSAAVVTSIGISNLLGADAVRNDGGS